MGVLSQSLEEIKKASAVDRPGPEFLIAGHMDLPNSNLHHFAGLQGRGAGPTQPGVLGL